MKKGVYGGIDRSLELQPFRFEALGDLNTAVFFGGADFQVFGLALIRFE
jgi:hypothetical protein